MTNHQAKYIVFMYGGAETPIIFPEHVGHSDFVLFLTSNPKANVISAGFCEVYENDIKVWGKSFSLNKECRKKEDKELLEKMMIYQE